jgi:hypothetical protein
MQGRRFPPLHEGQLQAEDAAHPQSPLLTVLTSSHGPIVKRFSLVDDALLIDPSAQIYHGHAQTVFVDGPACLLSLIKSLKPNEALSLGTLSEVGPRFALSSEHLRREGEISRTKEFLKWNDGPAWMLLDVDTKGLPDTVLSKIGNRDLADAITDVVPEIATAPRVIRASSSAGIQMPDGTMRPASGLHVYVLVANGRDIPQLLGLIHDRLWAAGLGYFAVSKSGTLLERSLVDTSVGSPERLIFAAAPIVRLPLTRNPPPPRMFINGVPLAHVAPTDNVLVERLQSEAREIIKPTALAQQKHHEKRQIDHVSETLRITKAEARRIVKQRLEMQLLNEDDLLETGRGRFERVGDFLDRTVSPTALPCPIEGSNYGTSKAYFYPADSRSPVPRIVSFAHGNITVFNFARFRRLSGLCWIES